VFTFRAGSGSRSLLSGNLTFAAAQHEAQDIKTTAKTVATFEIRYNELCDRQKSEIKCN